MSSGMVGQAPGLASFLKSLKFNDIETSIELFISLVRRRQIRSSRPCAIATAQLLLRVVAVERIRDVHKLIGRIRSVGRRLIAAQPRELTIGNVVRRILGVVREIAEQDQDGDDTTTGDATPVLAQSTSSLNGFPTSATKDPGSRPSLATSVSYAGQAPQTSSLLSFLEHPLSRSPAGTPPTSFELPAIDGSKGPKSQAQAGKIDIKAEVIDGIKELLDELEVVDSQISESALDHIHSNEVILTHTSSQTIQRFLMTAARKRKFTVVHAEAYPNDHQATHDTILNGSKKMDSGDDPEADERWKALTAMGVTVMLIPDTAVFALMSRINKVILAPCAVLANGSLLAAAGASTIAHAAKAHRVPVVVLSGVYKLSPVFPFNVDELIEYGDPGKAVPFEDGQFMDKIEVSNPTYDWVEAELVDLYITNLGGCAPSYLYRIVADHYSREDISLSNTVSEMA